MASRSCGAACTATRSAKPTGEVYFTADELLPDEVLFPYPDPEVVGLKMEQTEMARIKNVASGSPADRAGFKPGDDIVTLGGQPLLSVAILMGAARRPCDSGVASPSPPRWETVDLWHRANGRVGPGDVSWRVTTWDLRRRGFGGMKLDALSDGDERVRIGIPADRMAIFVAFVGENGEHAVAKKAGVANRDILVSFDGKDGRIDESELLAYSLRRPRRQVLSR